MQYKPRTIEISYDCSNVPGIYKIMFGEKYYIGCAVNIKARMRQHLKAINISLAFRVINPNGSYTNIKKHLVANRKIKTATVILLEQCDPRLLKIIERSYLEAAYKDKNCLNVPFYGFFKVTNKIRKILDQRSHGTTN